MITYHLADDILGAAAARRAEERRRQGRRAVPGLRRTREERLETPPLLQLVVRDHDGVVRRLAAPTTAGLHRVAWDPRTGDRAGLACHAGLRRAVGDRAGRVSRAVRRLRR